MTAYKAGNSIIRNTSIGANQLKNTHCRYYNLNLISKLYMHRILFSINSQYIVYLVRNDYTSSGRIGIT